MAPTHAYVRCDASMQSLATALHSCAWHRVTLVCTRAHHEAVRALGACMLDVSMQPPRVLCDADTPYALLPRVDKFDPEEALEYVSDRVDELQEYTHDHIVRTGGMPSTEHLSRSPLVLSSTAFVTYVADETNAPIGVLLNLEDAT